MAVKEIKEDIKNRDSIDFSSGEISTLFRKMFIPTLFGMVSMVVLNLADGAFVGHGVGSDALAAVNIAAPIFDLMIGVGLMFGIGSSVVSSIHLSRNNVKAARINATQALACSLIFTSAISILILSDLGGTCKLFGSSEYLVPLASKYLKWIAIGIPICILGDVASFIVRLDGSPKYSMTSTLAAAVLNIFLDWLFIFPMDMGLEGAAIATVSSFAITALINLFYLFFKAETLKLYRLRLTLKSLALTSRNLWFQMRAGFSAMLGQFSLSYSVIIGNFVFIKYLAEDGVAAYSVICYCLPLVYMMANATVQSSQPIISFAYGHSDIERMKRGRNMAFAVGSGAGLLSSLVFMLCPGAITLIFLPSGEHAFELCRIGLVWFGTGCLFTVINIVFTGYLQSIERNVMATAYSILRGFLLLTAAFITLPEIWGVPGIWLSIPVAEALTFVIMTIISYFWPFKNKL